MCLKMAAQAEDRMNLAALQQRDPYITDIVDTASQVALYSFNPNGREWEKTSIEGTLFVYKRSASPINGFMILNRLGLNNLIEPIIKGLEFQLQDPFLLYRNPKAIYGIWFYDKDECARIGQLMNCLVQLAIEHHNAKSANSMRQRRASESDSMQDRPIESVQKVDSQQEYVDLIQMLSNAQHEYVKSKGGPRSHQKSEPKPMIDNPNAAATKATATQLIRPLPVKLSPSPADGDGGGEREPGGGTTPTSIDLEALFRNASINKQRIAPGSVEAFSADMSSERLRISNRSISMSETSSYEKESRGQSAPQPPGTLHPMLQRLMSSNPRIESIECQQLSPQHPPGPGGDVPPPVPLRVSSQQTIGGSGGINLETMIIPGSTSPTQSMSFSIIKPQEKSPEVLPVFISPDMLLSTQKTGPDKSSARNLEERIANICSNVSSTDTSSEMPTMDPPKALLTPAEFETTSATSEMLQPPLAVTLPAPAFNPDLLLSPMVFTTTARISSPFTINHPFVSLLGESTVQPSSLSSELSPPVTPQINPLTKQQLQQALVHLLQTDSDFITKIHDAYLKSLKASLSSGKS